MNVPNLIRLKQAPSADWSSRHPADESDESDCAGSPPVRRKVGDAAGVGPEFVVGWDDWAGAGVRT